MSTLRGYSLVMKPNRIDSGKKTLKIYGVYEDNGGKACIQRVSEVENTFKEQIIKILGSGAAEKKVVKNEGNVDENTINYLMENRIGAHAEIKTGGKTQKRLPKRKRSIFSRKK